MEIFDPDFSSDVSWANVLYGHDRPATERSANKLTTHTDALARALALAEELARLIRKLEVDHG